MQKGLNFPTKKLFYFAVPVIIALSILSIFKINIYEKFFLKNGSPGVLSVKNSTVKEIDTDNDGLKDWEETLLGTDPQNPDSDNNGIPDSKENVVQKNSSGVAIFDKQNNIVVDKAETKTDALTQKFLIDYLTLKKIGAVNPSTINDLAINFQEAALLQPRTYKLYTKNDLVVLEENNTNLINYANNLYFLFSKNGGTLANSLSNTKTSDIFSPEYSKTVLAISNTYKNTAKELIKIAAPKGLANTHLALTNNHIKIAEDLKGISDGENDYLLMVGSIKNFEVDRAEELNLLKTLNNYLDGRGIIFSIDDQSYVLNKQ